MNKKIKQMYEEAVLKAAKQKGFSSTNYDVAEIFAKLIKEDMIADGWSPSKRVDDEDELSLWRKIE